MKNGGAALGSRARRCVQRALEKRPGVQSLGPRADQLRSPPPPTPSRVHARAAHGTPYSASTVRPGVGATQGGSPGNRKAGGAAHQAVQLPAERVADAQLPHVWGRHGRTQSAVPAGPLRPHVLRCVCGCTPSAVQLVPLLLRPGTRHACTRWGGGGRDWIGGNSTSREARHPAELVPRSPSAAHAHRTALAPHQGSPACPACACVLNTDLLCVRVCLLAQIEGAAVNHTLRHLVDMFVAKKLQYERGVRFCAQHCRQGWRGACLRACAPLRVYFSGGAACAGLGGWGWLLVPSRA
jgi:hypothetical protein